MNWYNFWYKVSFYYVVGWTAYIVIACIVLIVVSLGSQYGLMEPFAIIGPDETWYLVKKGLFIELPFTLLPVAIPWLIYYLIHGKIRKPE